MTENAGPGDARARTNERTNPPRRDAKKKPRKITDPHPASSSLGEAIARDVDVAREMTF
jgi:hypothetical protein